MQESKEWADVAAPKLGVMIENEDDEGEARAKRHRAINFFNDLGELFAIKTLDEFSGALGDIGNGFVDVGHDKLLPKIRRGKRRCESKPGARQYSRSLPFASAGQNWSPGDQANGIKDC